MVREDGDTLPNPKNRGPQATSMLMPSNPNEGVKFDQSSE